MTCYQQHMFPLHTTEASQPFNGIAVVVFSSPTLHITNTFPRSGSTCAQGICLRVSQQISLGQGLRLASSNRLLKTAPQHDERGKCIFQLKSRIISAQGIILCSKRLIKWDAIDTVLHCSWISAGHVSFKKWLHSFYIWEAYSQGCVLTFVLNEVLPVRWKCNIKYNLLEKVIFLRSCALLIK